MSTTIGELRLPLLLDLVPMNESIKTAMSLLRMFHTNANDALKLSPPTFANSDFDAQVTKLNTTLSNYTQKTTEAGKEAEQFGEHQKQNTVLTERFSGTLQNAFLRIEGFRSILSLAKSTFGDLMGEYEKQEVVDAKLANNMKNVGEGIDSVNKLKKQAGQFQEITVYGDETIEDGQAMLGTFKKTSDEIEVLTPRMLDLSAAFDASGEGGKNLTEVAVMLGKVNEETIGTLRRVGVAFSKEQEEKLKSLEGMEQTLYLADILDSNFKGLAVTVGQTSAGQMAIFKNKIGEVKEGLGQVLAEGFMPTIVSIGNMTTGLATASPAVKTLTIGVIAMSTAFVVLNTSMGATPYIIMAIVTAYLAVNNAFSISSEKIEENKNKMLENQQVSEKMKTTLDGLEISANNMAEAYKGISDAIIGMTRTQLESAKQFVQAEIAKIEAVRETAKALRSEELRKLDVSTYDANKRVNQEVDQFIQGSEYGANLDKLNAINDQIDAKMKFTPKEDKKDTSTGKTAKQNAEEEKDIVDETIKSWDGLIERHNSSVESLRAKGESEIDIIRKVSEAIATAQINETQLTDDQILKLDSYRKRLASGIEVPIITIGGEDLQTQIEADVWARRQAYEEKNQYDGKAKPFDEVDAFRKSLQIRKEQNAENLTEADYLSFIEMTKERISTLDANNLIDLDKIKILTDDISKYNKSIEDSNKNKFKLANDEYRMRLAMIDDEFTRRRELSDINYREELNNLDELEKKTSSIYEKSIIGQMRNDAKKKKDKELEKIDSEELSHQANTLYNSFTGALQNSQSIARLFGKAGDDVVEAFQRALNLAQAIKTVMDTIGLIKSLIGLFSGGGSLAAGAVPIFHSGGEIGGLPGGDVHIIAQEGEGIINRTRMQELKSRFGSGFFEWLNGGTLMASISGVYHSGGIISAGSASPTTIIREVPYISTYKVEARDFQSILNRQKTIDKYRGKNS